MDFTGILIKPVVTEKSSLLSEKENKYVFIVQKSANKITIKKAVESMYGVAVDNVSTIKMVGKDRSKWTNKGFAKGRTGAYKKAVVTVAKGDTIDFYSNI